MKKHKNYVINHQIIIIIITMTYFNLFIIIVININFNFIDTINFVNTMIIIKFITNYFKNFINFNNFNVIPYNFYASIE